jgi:hypothetical protein
MLNLSEISITVASRGRGKFVVHLDGRLLVTSRTPFCEAARVLLAEGHDPAVVLQMRRPDRAACCWDLRGPIGKAASLTVREDNGPPQFAPYRPPVFRTGRAPAALRLGGGAGGRLEPLAGLPPQIATTAGVAP